MDAQVVISDFEVSRHAEVYSLAKKAWYHAYSGFLDEGTLNARLNCWYSRESHEGMAWNVKNKGYFFKVLQDANRRLIGFISGNTRTGVLDRLYLDPAEMGKGYGSRLLELFLGELKANGIAECRACCDRKNRLGLEFYRRKGFRVIEEHGEDYALAKAVE